MFLAVCMARNDAVAWMVEIELAPDRKEHVSTLRVGVTLCVRCCRTLDFRTSEVCAKCWHLPDESCDG
jgi:hypothetical protein